MLHFRLSATLVLSTLCGTAAAIQPAQEPAPAGTAVASDLASSDLTLDAAGAVETGPPLGWLSYPDTPAATIQDALFGGKIHLNNRFRVELADTTGRDSSTAVTNRIRLGYETKAFHGFSGMVEMENVYAFDEDNYFVPATGDGTPSRTVVADPPDTEVNQAYFRYHAESLGESGVSLDLKAGRQRIKLDDDRFVGNVGWRQFEQTYDALRAVSNLGVDWLTAQYAYVWHVQRVFSDDGPNWDSESHFINVSAEVADELTITPFAYLLDFQSDSPANSSDSYGVRLTGSLSPSADEGVTLGYEFTYAHQTDAGSNPTSYDADFFAAEARLAKKDLGGLTVGYQFLGSDSGVAAFRFPLGTNHKFQGFDDLFLVTPATGLQDFYVGVNAKLPHGIKAAFTFHQFWSDIGSMDLGSEYDMVASKAITPNWAVLVKAAFFDGHNGQPDVSRVWLQTEFKF